MYGNPPPLTVTFIAPVVPWLHAGLVELFTVITIAGNAPTTKFDSVAGQLLASVAVTE